MADTINFTPEAFRFTPELAQAFRKAYKQAVDQGQDQFVFEGKDVLTSYAKYLCEFLIMKGLLEDEG